jgi:hypothetical protein
MVNLDSVNRFGNDPESSFNSICDLSNSKLIIR